MLHAISGMKFSLAEKSHLHQSLVSNSPSVTGCVRQVFKLASILVTFPEPSLIMFSQNTRLLHPNFTVVYRGSFRFPQSILINSHLLKCCSILDSSLNILLFYSSYLFDQLSLAFKWFLSCTSPLQFMWSKDVLSGINWPLNWTSRIQPSCTAAFEGDHNLVDPKSFHSLEISTKFRVPLLLLAGTYS